MDKLHIRLRRSNSRYIAIRHHSAFNRIGVFQVVICCAFRSNRQRLGLDLHVPDYAI